jgi:N-acetylglucosaminyldiphosphoundecaprenol N-acetyl-beta-D-mannosaminyltransferase
MCGVHFTPIDRAALHDRIVQVVQSRARELILNVNVHAINLAQTDPQFRDHLNTAPVTFCDGFGIRLGALILGQQVPPRITYADWLWELARLADQQGFALYLLGARPGVPEQAAQALQARYPTLKVVGTQHGYFDKRTASAENQAIVAAINHAQPDLLIACMGMPVQEHWLAANWEHLNVPVALAGGAALDYVSGNLQRGPRWMTDHGLEWLARLIIEPRRLWRRYILGNPVFLLRVIAQRLGLRRF